MMGMTHHERVMTALHRGQPDQVPWMENDIEEALQVQIMGGADFTPPELAEKLGISALGAHFPTGAASDGQGLVTKETYKESYYNPKKVTFDFFPPWIAKMGADPATGRTYIEKGLLVSEESLKLFDEFLPDPHHPGRYDKVNAWLKQYKGEYAVFARIRLGAASTIESMGLDEFSYAQVDNPELIHKIHRRFSEWSAEVVDHLNEMDIDFFWANDDLAGNQGPFMSPKVFRELMLPNMKIVADRIKKPWIFHSDGNLFPIMEDLLSLGMTAVHPIQPAAMDIGKMKREYGQRVAIVGNIDLDYTLPLGSVDEVDAEVKNRIMTAGPGGGYIISSANSLTDYCKLENVLAMSEAIKKYGKYPLEG
ncbi:MAG: uroporphyrinogen decarboxylase family protein [Desulfitobacteriaceae bacterium]|nr:uroporphyrinogen decarboxylase family protein [Desulfitobacteriaceae bacterium]MDI6878381.1 uroporphyrinogen decarboxylase family protein [Desulfitobacteriaceae bacterium]MDI6913277.1 uroporphyrinogen decarboxylase family protein [Desulfitobacteriaceae bacterium]